MDNLIEQLRQQIPAWAGRINAVEPLAGGITNQNYKVTVGDEAFVVHVCARDVAIHGINRQVEVQCARAAAKIGVAPEVIALLDNLPSNGSSGHELFITRFVQAQTLTAAAVRSPELLPQIVATIQRYHRLTDFAGHFDVFHIFEQGLAFAREHHTPLPPFIDQVQAEMQRIETAFQRDPLPEVASHNDLLPANFLLDNDGRVWLIDWEYAGWGDPFFDLGNLSINNEFDDAQDVALLTAYFGEVTAIHLARLKLMKIVSDAREGIWAMVQQSISELEFDFAAYGNHHLERFISNCASPEAPQWLAALQT